MSTAIASGDGWEPVVGLGPSPARAFLHALVSRLHRLADGIVHGIRTITARVGQVARTVVSGAASVLSLAFTRGGLRAAIGLLVTAGQIAAYALREGAGRIAVAVRQAAHSSASWVRSATTTVESRARIEHAARLARSPWVIASTLLAAVILTVSIAISRRWGRRQQLVDGDLSLTLDEGDRERLMAGLYVVPATDGSVRVHGIPGSLDAELRTRIAQVAAHAAEQRLETLIQQGRPLTTLDLQAINVAARSALAQHLDHADMAA